MIVIINKIENDTKIAGVSKEDIVDGGVGQG